ncbi:hypothetical protein KAR10_07910 [bacterium]|nr:hypothetical protein [bacterium]
MKNIVAVITGLTLSSLILVSCSSQNPTSPATDPGNSSVISQNPEEKRVLNVIGGQVNTQSIDPTEQIGTATLIVEKENGKSLTLYVKLYGVITSAEPGKPTVLRHDMEIYQDPEYTKFRGLLHSEGDQAITTGVDFPLVTIHETVNIVSGTKKYATVDPASSIVVTGTLNLVTGQNQFDVISGILIY